MKKFLEVSHFCSSVVWHCDKNSGEKGQTDCERYYNID